MGIDSSMVLTTFPSTTKTKQNKPIVQTSIPMSGSLSKGTEINVFFRDICLFVFPTKLLITAKKWKHPQFSSMDGEN